MKEQILNNLNKLGNVKSSFLKEHNLTLKECYDIVRNIQHMCEYCENEAEFKSFKSGYKRYCKDTKCMYTARQEKIKQTCLERYGVENVFKSEQLMLTREGEHKSRTLESITARESTLLSRYGTTDSLSINDGRIRGIEKCINDADVADKRANTCLEKYGVDNPFKSKDIQHNISRSFIEKYGMLSCQTPEVRKKISDANKIICTSEVMKDRRNKKDENGVSSIDKQKQTNINNGKWFDDSTKSSFDLYRREVWWFTNRQDITSLTNVELRGHSNNNNSYHLDHKYSIHQGFINGVSSEIIGSIHNLEMLHHSANSSKGSKCSIELDELMEKFNVK